MAAIIPLNTQHSSDLSNATMLSPLKRNPGHNSGGETWEPARVFHPSGYL